MTTVTTKNGAALASVASGALLTTLKLIVGIATGSLAILAEAAHSALDLVAAGITYGVVRVSDLPPDANHPYGHARAEHLGALAETILLVVTAIWVLYESFQRIFVHVEMPEVTPWAFVVLVISLVVDWRRTRALKSAAEQFKSAALAADAAHFSNDMISTLVVLASLAVIAVAQPFALLPAWLLIRLDAVAAVAVALIALGVSWRMGGHAIRSLMDDVPPDISRRLLEQVTTLPSVIPESVHMRTRFIGSRPYVEVTLGTPRGGSLEEAHALTEHVEDVIRAELADADVLVHIEPTRAPAEPYSTAVYATAQRLGLQVHNLDIYQLANEVRVDVDLELPDDLLLGEAHTWSERLETAIQRELGDHTTIAVHLEPRRDQVRPAVRYAPLTAALQRAVADLSAAHCVSGVETLLTDEGTIVILRCAFAAESPLRDVHAVMASIEQELRRAAPDLLRVQIDPEPTTAQVTKER